MSCDICTMSKVSGARYSTVTPRSSAAWSTPFLTTDQNGIGGLAMAHHHEPHVLRCSGAGNSQSGGDDDSLAKHGFHACTPC